MALGGLARADVVSLGFSVCVSLGFSLGVPDSHRDSYRDGHRDGHRDAYQLTIATQVTAQCQDMQPPGCLAAVSRAFGLTVAITVRVAVA